MHYPPWGPWGALAVQDLGKLPEYFVAEVTAIELFP
jgi:hypothetical protein